jgi:hypothetical protein
VNEVDEDDSSFETAMQGYLRQGHFESHLDSVAGKAGLEAKDLSSKA